MAIDRDYPEKDFLEEAEKEKKGLEILFNTYVVGDSTLERQYKKIK